MPYKTPPSILALTGKAMVTSTMIMSSAYLQLLCLVLLLERTINANHLSCVCSLAECENVNDVDCPNGAGTVWDSCRCCRICARVENEPCGGPYGFSGSCAEGLECVISDFFNKNGVGVCTRKYGFRWFYAFVCSSLRCYFEYIILLRTTDGSVSDKKASPACAELTQLRHYHRVRLQTRHCRVENLCWSPEYADRDERNKSGWVKKKPLLPLSAARVV